MSDQPSREAIEAAEKIYVRLVNDELANKPGVTMLDIATIIDAAFAPTLAAADELAKQAFLADISADPSWEERDKGFGWRSAIQELRAAVAAYHNLREGKQ